MKRTVVVAALVVAALAGGAAVLLHVRSVQAAEARLAGLARSRHAFRDARAIEFTMGFDGHRLEARLVRKPEAEADESRLFPERVVFDGHDATGMIILAERWLKAMRVRELEKELEGGPESPAAPRAFPAFHMFPLIDPELAARNYRVLESEPAGGIRVVRLIPNHPGRLELTLTVDDGSGQVSAAAGRFSGGRGDWTLAIERDPAAATGGSAPDDGRGPAPGKERKVSFGLWAPAVLPTGFELSRVQVKGGRHGGIAHALYTNGVELFSVFEGVDDAVGTDAGAGSEAEARVLRFGPLTVIRTTLDGTRVHVVGTLEAEELKATLRSMRPVDRLGAGKGGDTAIVVIGNPKPEPRNGDD